MKNIILFFLLLVSVEGIAQTCTIYNNSSSTGGVIGFDDVLVDSVGEPGLSLTLETFFCQTFTPCDNGYLRDYSVRMDPFNTNSVVDAYFIVFQGTSFPGFANVDYAQNLGVIEASSGWVNVSIPEATVPVLAGTTYSTGLFFPPDGSLTTNRKWSVYHTTSSTIPGTLYLRTFGFVNGAWQPNETILPNLDLIGSLAMDIDQNSLGINEFDISTFKMYPNPAKNEISIEYNDVKKVTLYSLTGKKLLETTSKTFDISHLDSGIYLTEVTDSNDNTHIKRLIKY